MHRARLISLSAPFSGSWVTSPPLDPLLTLNDIQFSLAVRLRLGITPEDLPRCACGASLKETPLHFLTCMQLKASRTSRHDGLVQVVARVARSCGVVTQIEPRLDENDQSRADGHLFFHAQSAAGRCCVYL